MPDEMPVRCPITWDEFTRLPFEERDRLFREGDIEIWHHGYIVRSEGGGDASVFRAGQTIGFRLSIDLASKLSHVIQRIERHVTHGLPITAKTYADLAKERTGSVEKETPKSMNSVQSLTGERFVP